MPNIETKMGRKPLVIAAAGIMLLILCVGTTLRSNPAQAVPAHVLRAAAPTQVEVGEPIRITLAVKGATDIGGYETNLLFDTDAAEFAGLSQLNKDLTKLGRDVGSLGPVEQPWGVSVGAFSCPVEECTRPGNGPEAKGGIGGTVEPATVTVVPTREGRLEFRLAATKFVDATGRPLRVSGGEKSFVVQVGPRKVTDANTAPDAVPWELKDSAASSQRSRDLTGDEKVTHADAMEAALAWTMLREGGSACGGAVEDPSRDVNGDGCVDVADVQTIVANYDTRASTGTSSSEQSEGAAPAVALSAMTSLLDWMLPRPALAQGVSTFTVDSTADGADANAGNGVCATPEGACTLRAAIEETNLHPGADTIAFGIPGTGVKTITLGSTLPTINDETGSTTIDGYTQPGASPNTDASISNAKIMVQITASTAYPSGVYGLTVSSPGNTIRGLAIYKIRRTTWLYGPNATNNTVAGNFIGTNAAGSFGAASFVDDGEGVRVQNGASSNNIGVASPEGRNVISGNARRGISLYEQCNFNRIVNNIVGLGPLGDKRLANLRIGVDLNLSAANNQIGGNEPYERNVISGNTWEGVELSHGETVSGNKVIGNFIGTDATGNAAPAYALHERWGVQVEDRPTDNVIADNVIGNSSTKGGILITQVSRRQQIHGNRIGISPNGTAIPNALSGIQIDGINGLSSPANKVGPSNIIANNGEDGVRIYGADSDKNTVTRNSTFGNGGLGIDLQPLGAPNPNDAGDTDTGSNEQLNFPELETSTSQEVTGTVCGGCTVEVFIADSGAGAYGEGRRFLGSAVAGSGGSFAVPVTGVSGGDYVTTTATDTVGNTSEFSPNKEVIADDTTAPAQPTGLTATGSESGIALDWSDNTEPDLGGYNVYRSDSLDGQFVKLNASALTESQYNDSEAPAGQDTFYRVTALDESGNESAPANASAFRPEAADTTAPTIASKTPKGGATGVVVGTNVEAVFSEDMDPSTITNTTFRLVKANTTARIATTVGYDQATKKATLDPSADLAANTTYKATVNTGVKDLAGNPMAKLVTWKFTTGTTP